MALAPPPPANDRKRVKVYELKSNDWFDRGTGFCTGSLVNDEARIHVQSEDEPVRTLLETKIGRDEGYQKQQDTLIVWTETNGTDMALSFQEAEGCGAIWEFVSDAQQRLGGGPAADDGLSDEAIETFQPITLPDPPQMENLQEIENIMRAANSTAQGREALAKAVMAAEYIHKLVPFVEIAEREQSLADLHRLCNIMKILVLLNDTAMIELAVTDDVIFGVVGAFEYDPDFPSHKANHRQYLADETRFKEVVPFDDPNVKRKIHHTYRLQYLKDVVLARILDDTTFTVLNGLIFFHQVDIVQHLQGNVPFLKELFGIFAPQETDQQRKKDGVAFIQQCCALAKSLQPQARNALYNNFINGGLFNVITFALRHQDASVRVAGTDILVALIDHDAPLIRNHIFKAVNENTKPLTDTLIELLLVEVDVGVKAQIADAIKVLLDPNANGPSLEALARGNNEYMAKFRGGPMHMPPTEMFIQRFYDDSARRLFQALKDLEHRQSMDNLNVQEVLLFSHLVEILSFFLRQHAFRSKQFILQELLACRVAQLMACPEKHLKLTALKYFRTCIGLKDEYYNKQIIQHHLFEPILNIVFETKPKDNLLNSACLEMFETIRRENMKSLVVHLVENYRDRLQALDYVETFPALVLKYDQYNQIADQNEPLLNHDQSFTSTETETPNRNIVNGGMRWQGLKDHDPEEDAYFNGPDNEEEANAPATAKAPTNGVSPQRPLVNYPDDEDELPDLPTDPTTTSPPADSTATSPPSDSPSPSTSARSPAPLPSTKIAEKRRREDEDDDELGKLSAHPKRRNSSGQPGAEPPAAHQPPHGHMLRRKRSIQAGKDPTGKKIAISLAMKGDANGKDGA
ncbi:DUF625-domain-containing protein [Eremomyces bilateralis CBS 781.70]|uniref:DUF625-domain-containing protein n=1 Tax=Eremomyces bilateralis CBS 781.70 TaxID=1392243 RepID=A0A6G1G3Y7_9PEZI|nr:DUF625-domain-containing protein [Eremomyces bilateralis CBS 781.70]KAF1812630.1 DUF625-domain-containing protein [Eremomyces bilateralis CBS 781.70]